MKHEKPLYSLVPFEDFKTLLNLDDRDDKLIRFCLVSSTYSIEQYCRRRLTYKKHFELLQYHGEWALPLREYPVAEVLAVFAYGYGGSEMMEHELYELRPECESGLDIQGSLILSAAFRRFKNLTDIKVVYNAGYKRAHVPPDLASACLELAWWKMNRYKTKRVGMTGNVRANGKDGEYFELSMPENVRGLLESYKRRVI